jgi:NADP-dependent 3-hydroxy acid dehydrogenase YdfG
MRWVWRCVLVAAASALAPWLSRPVLGENLLGQVAVVTGGGRGLGRGIAQALGEAGATVFITGRTEAPLLESCRLISPPGRCIPKIVDSANDSSLEEFFAGVSRETNGELDILVNNAYSAVGYWGKNRLLGKPFWEAPMQLFDAVFDVGVRSHYKATVLAVPMMQKRGRGLIVNSNSPGCVMYAINVAYGMGKCAIDKMSSVRSHPAVSVSQPPSSTYGSSVVPFVVGGTNFMGLRWGRTLRLRLILRALLLCPSVQLLSRTWQWSSPPKAST